MSDFEKIQELELRIQRLENVIYNGGKSKQGDKSRFESLNELDLMIKKTLENNDHPILDGLDLVYTENLCTILENMYPDIYYFQFNSLTDEGERTKKMRSIAARMRKIGYVSLRARHYDSSQKRGRTITRSVWVLNDRHNYREFPETELAVIANEHWKAAFNRMYNIEDEVTFR
jgi:hypothetical protein|tara:strand:- start:642 stop:1163 length:522 start_codon:yes stop_codon:yes gene_type:complete